MNKPVKTQPAKPELSPNNPIRVKADNRERLMRGELTISLNPSFYRTEQWY